jgi:DNA invertase Pin-like site-specific DNA recombinase
MLKEYAKKNGIILTKEHIYTDEGISGKRADKRPSFMRMIATAKAKPKPFDVILVHKFDRFARSREDSVVYKSLLKKEAGVKVVSITESIEDDKFSVILEAMLEAMAEYYSLNLAEEVKKGMTEKANRGGLQSVPSFGYGVENNKLVIIPEEAKLVKFIFEQFANHKMGMRQLAVYMNDLGVKSHRGNLFENRSINYILNNPVYIGKLRWTPTGHAKRNFNHPDTIVSTGEHEPIIDIELWEKAQETIKHLKELYKPRTRPESPLRSWLKGLVRCGNCGKILNASKNGSFQCNGYSKGMCKPSASITIERLEGVVLEELKNTFVGSLEIKVVPKVSEVDTSSEFDFLTDKLKKLTLREERIKIAFQDGIDTLEEYKANKKATQEERQSTLDKLEQMKKKLICEEKGESVYKRIESVYHLLTDDKIPLDVKYKTAHFLISTVTYIKQENLLEIEYK